MIEKTYNGVVEFAGVTRRFGAIQALDDVNLSIPRGIVMGLVGENGSGKTTLIKHLLGLFKAQTGTVRVFDRDPVKCPVEVLSRIGYLSEARDLPAWMRVGELMRYLRAFYPTWDDAFAEQLRKQFELDAGARIKTLSQGQRARAGLLAALAYRPELLVLDEPSTGLDPVVRREILAAIIRTIADEGRTVLFSSHLLDEVERVSDFVAMIDRGKIVLCGQLDQIKSYHHKITLRFDEPTSAPADFPGDPHWDGWGNEWTAICRGELHDLATRSDKVGARIVAEQTPTLDEIFVARVRRRHAQTVEA